jgi:hypothetical protein
VEDLGAGDHRTEPGGQARSRARGDVTRLLAKLEAVRLAV